MKIGKINIMIKFQFLVVILLTDFSVNKNFICAQQAQNTPAPIIANNIPDNKSGVKTENPASADQVTADKAADNQNMQDITIGPKLDAQKTPEQVQVQKEQSPEQNLSSPVLSPSEKPKEIVSDPNPNTTNRTANPINPVVTSPLTGQEINQVNTQAVGSQLATNQIPEQTEAKPTVLPLVESQQANINEPAKTNIEESVPEKEKSISPAPEIETSRVKQAHKKVKIEESQVEIRPGKILLDFTFNNEDLTAIISKVAQAKDINIILPLAPNNITQKVSFGIKGKITVEQAWDYLLSILELSGYAITKSQDGMYTIVKSNQNISRENMPLYINVAPDKLPYSDQRIRYVYYLSNIKVPESNMGSEPLNLLLKEILTSYGTFLYDPKSNAIIIMDTARNIASVVEAVIKMDNIGYKEGFEFVQLLYTQASSVVKLLKDLIPQPADNKVGYGAPRTNVKTDSSYYFTPGTRVIAAERENRVIIIGKDTSISRIRDFITSELDVAPQSGKSILHTYDLQYLDAESFAKDLTKIVSSGGGAQDQTVKDSQTNGPERFFEGVIVLAETYKEVKEASEVAGAKAGAVQSEQSSSGGGAGVFQGGNRLIVAARESDWLRIQELIRKLDRPQPQVILEVLILDISKINNDSLSGSSRNAFGLFDKEKSPNYLTSQISNLNDLVGTSPTTLAADLLRYVTEANPINVPTGSLIVSLEDPSGSGIWGLITLLKGNTNIKVVSHPFLVTTNNKKAFVESVVIRRQAGESDGQKASGAITVKQEDIPAKIRVDLVPRISSLDRLNLKINVYIEDFVAPQDSQNFSRRTRTISTNANLGSGQVLALGGLLSTVENDDITETPLIAKIPVIGWLFKSKTVILNKSNLVVFVSPTIIEPKLRAGLTRYSADKIKQLNKNLDEGEYDTMFKEPIEHMFFGERHVGEESVQNYLSDSKTTNIKVEDILPKKRRQARERYNKKYNIPGTRVTTSNSGSQDKSKMVKDLIAFEDNPFLRVKERKG